MISRATTTSLPGTTMSVPSGWPLSVSGPDGNIVFRNMPLNGLARQADMPSLRVSVVRSQIALDRDPPVGFQVIDILLLETLA
jgi:hypothetical protein